MSFGSRLYKIARSPIDLGAQALDLVFDGVIRLPEEQFDIIDSFWESWRDNIMGQESKSGTGEKSVLGSAFGPEGVIGSTVGALPTEGKAGIFRREGGKLLWDPMMQSLQYTYKNYVDRPIGTVATLYNIALAENNQFYRDNPQFGGLNTFNPVAMLDEVKTRVGDGVFDSRLYDMSTYSDVWNITESRSAGQAIILALRSTNILDAEELEQEMATQWYQIGSGIIDFNLNIVGDPAFLVAKGMRAGYANKLAKQQYAQTGTYDLNALKGRSPFTPFLYKDDIVRPGRRGKPDRVINRDTLFWEKWDYNPQWEKRITPATVSEAITSPGFVSYKQTVQNIGYRLLGELTPEARGDIDPNYLTSSELPYDLPDPSAANPNVLIDRKTVNVADPDFPTKTTFTNNILEAEDLAINSLRGIKVLWDEVRGGRETLNIDVPSPESFNDLPSNYWENLAEANQILADRAFAVETELGELVRHKEIVDEYKNYLNTFFDDADARVSTFDNERFELSPDDIFLDESIETLQLEFEKLSQQDIAFSKLTDIAQNAFENRKRYLIAKAEGGIDLADSGPNRIITENGYVDISSTTSTETFANKLAIKILQAGRKGELGPGWKNWDLRDAWVYSQQVARMWNVGDVTSASWLPFDNYMRLRLNAPDAVKLFEEQARVLSSILFLDDTLGTTTYSPRGLTALENLATNTRNIRYWEDVSAGVVQHTDYNSSNPLSPEAAKALAEDQLVLLREYKKVMEERDPAFFTSIEAIIKDELQVIQSKTTFADELYGEEGIIDTNAGVTDRPPEPGTFEYDAAIDELEGLSKIPWNAILAVRETYLQKLMAPYDLNQGIGLVNPPSRLKHGLEGYEHITDMAVAEILRTSHIPILPQNMLPYLGPENRLGFKARTFFEKSEFVSTRLNSRAARVTVEKVPQGIANWHQPDHALVQVERMLRDVSRISGVDGVPILEKAGLNADDVMIEFLNKTTSIPDMVEHYDFVVNKLVDQLVDTFADIPHPITNPNGLASGPKIVDKQQVIEILRGDLTSAQEILTKAADEGLAKEATFGNVDYTTLVINEDGQTISRNIAISPSQMRDSSVVPRFDMYERLVQAIVGDYKTVLDTAADGTTTERLVHIGSSRATIRNARRLATTYWKKSVLLTPRWQMVVNIDSLLRTVATVGAAATVGRIGDRVDTLRSRWLTKAGVDVDAVVETKLYESIQDIEFNANTDTLSSFDRIQIENRKINSQLTMLEEKQFSPAEYISRNQLPPLAVTDATSILTDLNMFENPYSENIGFGEMLYGHWEDSDIVSEWNFSDVDPELQNLSNRELALQFEQAMLDGIDDSLIEKEVFRRLRSEMQLTIDYYEASLKEDLGKLARSVVNSQYVSNQGFLLQKSLPSDNALIGELVSTDSKSTFKSFPEKQQGFEPDEFYNPLTEAQDFPFALLDQALGDIERTGTSGQNMFVATVNWYNKQHEAGIPGYEVSYQEFVENIINEEYAKGRKRRRIGLSTGLGLFFAGPAGAAAAGAAYSRYSRNTLAIAAQKQIADSYGQQLLLEAHDMLQRMEDFEATIVETRTRNLENVSELGGISKQDWELIYSRLDEDLLTMYVERNRNNQLDINNFEEPFTTEQVQLLMAEISDELDIADWLAARTKDRREAAKLLATRAELVTDHQKNIVAKFKSDTPETAGRFEQAAEILADAGYTTTHVGDINLGNPWGDNPQVQKINERVNSANATKRHIWQDQNAVQRESERYAGSYQYDYVVPQETAAFKLAWNDFMARHAGPSGVAGVSANRDFWRQFWLGKSSEEVIEWLRTDGKSVLDNLPEEYRSLDGIRELETKTRYESESLIPDTPEFAAVRLKLAQGNEVKWDVDIQPIIDARYNAENIYLKRAIKENRVTRPPDDIEDLAILISNQRGFVSNNPAAALQTVLDMSPIERSRATINAKYDSNSRKTLLEEQISSLTPGEIPRDEITSVGSIDFGKTVTDSSFLDGQQTTSNIKRIKESVDSVLDNAFENLTMVEDIVSRGTLFESLYEAQMAMELQPFRNPDGTYRLDGEDIENLRARSRRRAIKETKMVLYDLAERSRFEEVMQEISPFLGAWTEVTSRWIGIAADNPVFVARALRSWGMLTAEDENRNSILVFQMPGVLDAEVFGKKVFGNISMLSKQKIDLNVKSAAMLGSLPTFGPIVSYLFTEAVLQAPEIMETLDWVVPYGLAEGPNVFARLVDSFVPSWPKALTAQYGMDQSGMAKTRVRVTQDYLAELWINGQEVPSSGPEMDAFVKEVDRRVSMVYGIKLMRSLTIPLAIKQQSPYWGTISEYWRKQDELGLEEADDWLLENHPELWSFTGRITANKGVIAGNLVGHQNYEKHKEIADRHPVLGGFVTGRDGAVDVQFERNEAVMQIERNRGNREYLPPEGILTLAAEKIGWREYGVFRESIDSRLRLKALSGGSASLNAKDNYEESRALKQFVKELGEENSQWLAEYNDLGNIAKQKQILQGFRDVVRSGDFDYRVELPYIEMFINLHDSIAKQMILRARVENNNSYLLLSYKGNEDLEQRWAIGTLKIREYPDFSNIYDVYFSNMDTVSTGNLTQSLVSIGA